MDTVDNATRSRIMARVRSKDTKPEIRVRSAAHRLGFRFRLHRKSLPGQPDVVFPARRVALFVHGCFWHGHDCRHGSRMPVGNAAYWRAKIGRNTERDAKNLEALRGMGWKPLIIWECQTKSADLPKLLSDALTHLG